MTQRSSIALEKELLVINKVEWNEGIIKKKKKINSLAVRHYSHHIIKYLKKTGQ